MKLQAQGSLRRPISTIPPWQIPILWKIILRSGVKLLGCNFFAVLLSGFSSIQDPNWITTSWDLNIVENDKAGFIIKHLFLVVIWKCLNIQTCYIMALYFRTPLEFFCHIIFMQILYWGDRGIFLCVVVGNIPEK